MTKETVRVIGLGYVGLANFCYLTEQSQWNNTEVFGYDINLERVKALREGHSPIADAEIENCLLAHKEDLSTCVFDNLKTASVSDVVVLCLPTDYNESMRAFNIDAFEKVSHSITRTKYLIIRSTIDFSAWKKIKEWYADKADVILYMPEFLREGSALRDEKEGKKNICTDPIGLTRRNYIQSLFLSKNLKWCSAEEAIMVKLGSNAYLATRVAFFNEIDTLCRRLGIDSTNVIDLMGKDERIGNKYNRPSFGFGGYCLPKDSKALADIAQTPLLESLKPSNGARSWDLAELVAKKIPPRKTIGVYKASMKPFSDNIRVSATMTIIKDLVAKGFMVSVYEPMLIGKENLLPRGVWVYDNFNTFLENCDVILSEYAYPELKKVKKTKIIIGEN